MCDQCGGTCGGGVAVQDAPAGSQHALAFAAMNDPQILLKALIKNYEEAKRQSEKLYDHSHPVDEYAAFPSVPSSGDILWQPDYELPARIESLSVVLPVGITSATLYLGERAIPLYSAAVSTSLTLINWTNLGYILNRSDVRKLSFGAPLGAPGFIALSGHCLEAGTGWR